jgi:hypothetical protein
MLRDSVFRRFSFLLSFLILWTSAAAAQLKVWPTLDCVEYNPSNNIVTAYFGYVSQEADVVTIVFGSSNFFLPAPPFRGQVTSFSPGVHRQVFTVVFPGSSFAEWSLNGTTVRATNDPALYCPGCDSPPGPPGAQGSQGPAGPAGATGATGATGPAGPEGPQGGQGPAGAQGPPGADGAAGAQGPAGATGATGATGSAGSQGPQGPQGATGAKGDPGPAGPQGPQGPRGETGPRGAIGPQGSRGPRGAAGADGRILSRTSFSAEPLHIDGDATVLSLHFSVAEDSTLLVLGSVGCRAEDECRVRVKLDGQLLEPSFRIDDAASALIPIPLHARTAVTHGAHAVEVIVEGPDVTVEERTVTALVFRERS